MAYDRKSICCYAYVGYVLTFPRAGLRVSDRHTQVEGKDHITVGGLLPLLPHREFWATVRALVVDGVGFSRARLGGRAASGGGSAEDRAVAGGARGNSPKQKSKKAKRQGEKQPSTADAGPLMRAEVLVALDVKIILTPPCIFH